MTVLILAAGYATRLYPITKDYPKPLLLIKDRPIIDYILDKIRIINGIGKVFVVTNSKFIGKFRAWYKNLEDKENIDLVDDRTKNNSDRLGAVGDMGFVIKQKKIKDDLLVIGGDNIFDADLRKFISFAKSKSGPVIGAYNIKDRSKAGGYGVLKLNKNNRIIDFQEKPAVPRTTFVAMCLYYFPRKSVKYINEYVENRREKDATGLYINWLRKKISAYAFVFEGKWYDIGDKNFYREAKNRFR